MFLSSSWDQRRTLITDSIAELKPEISPAPLKRIWRSKGVNCSLNLPGEAAQMSRDCPQDILARWFRQNSELFVNFPGFCIYLFYDGWKTKGVSIGVRHIHGLI